MFIGVATPQIRDKKPGIPDMRCDTPHDSADNPSRVTRQVTPV